MTTIFNIIQQLTQTVQTAILASDLEDPAVTAIIFGVLLICLFALYAIAVIVANN